MEYHLAINKNKILSFAITWIDVKDIMLREISQRQYGLISLVRGIEKIQVVNTAT